MRRSDHKAVLHLLRGLSAELPGAEEYVMVHHPAFRVGKKPFAIVGMDSDNRTTVSVNLGRDAQIQLLSDARFRKTPYIGQHGWVTAEFEALPEPELTALVSDSYRRVASKKQLALLQSRAPTGASLRTSPRAPKQATPRAATKTEPRLPTRAPKTSRSKSAPKGDSDLAGEDLWQSLGLAAPARRALQRAKLRSLRDLCKVSEARVRELHGMGPIAMKSLVRALAKAKLRFASA